MQPFSPYSGLEGQLSDLKVVPLYNCRRMNLAIFDIDGTLTESNEIDDACFVQAFQDNFGIQGIGTNWLDYRYQTDSGLALEICRAHLNRDPCEVEIRQLRTRFVELLSAAVNSGQIIREVHGATGVLNWLRGQIRWKAAIATGGWCEPARFKLATAGLPVGGLPWANSGDAVDRLDIIRIAIDRAKESYGRAAFERIVYVGDAVWDVRAAKALGIDFLGLATGERAALLVDEGASWVISDFSDLMRVSECLELVARSF